MRYLELKFEMDRAIGLSLKVCIHSGKAQWARLKIKRIFVVVAVVVVNKDQILP